MDMRSWKYKQKITVPKRTESLYNFTMPIYLNNSNFDFTKAKADGSDIRFTDKDLNPLKFERVEHFPNKIGIREHKNYSAYTPNVSVTYNNGALTISDTTDSLGRGLIVIPIKRSDVLSSKYAKLVIDAEYYCGSTVSPSFCQLFDGYYDYTSQSDFPDNADMPLKGSGIVKTLYEYSTRSRQITTYTLDVTGMTQDYVTLVIGLYDGWSYVSTNIFYSIQLVNSSNSVQFTLDKTSLVQTKSGTVSDTWTLIDNSDRIPLVARYNVLIPFIPYNTEEDIWMYYGNSTAYNTSIESWQDQTGKQLIYNGNVKLVPNVARFGKAAYFNGSNYLTLNDSEDWNIGSGDFTMGAWVRRTNASVELPILYQGTPDGVDNTALAFMFTIPTSGVLNFAYSVGAVWTNTAYTTATIGTDLTYVEVDRQGTNLYLFINGALSLTFNIGTATINNSAQPLYVGMRYTPVYGNGYLDDVFLDKGIARHTASFNIPTSPKVPDQYTKLLLHFDDFEAMRIAGTPTGTEQCEFDKNVTVDIAKTTVVEGSVKMESSGSVNGQQIAIRNGAKLTAIDIKVGSVLINGTITITMDTSSAYHIYNIELQGTTQAIFKIDGTIVATVPYASLTTSAVASQIWFGDGSSQVNYGGSALWKYFKYNLDYTGTPTAFVEWNATMGLPTSNGWVLGGTNVATLIFKDSNYIQDLYTNGDESSSVTGGWSTSAFTYSSYGRTSPIKNTSYVTISSAWGPPESACCIGTVNTIDLTIYDRLYAEVEITDAGIGYIGTTNKLNFSMGAGDVPSYVGLSPYDVGTHIVSCDISGRDGNFYIVAYTWANASGQSSSFRMKRIWLENATKSVTVYGDVKPIKTAYADGARGAYFDGSGDYFTVPDSDDWYFTGDFCIEVDCLLNALPASGSGIAIFDQYGTADMYFFIRNTSGTYTLEFSNGATNQIWCKQTILLTGGERFKAKLSRSGNTYRMFKNNVQIGSDYTNATAHTNCTGVISIGSYNSSGGNYMNGYLLGMRVSKGISRIVETQPDQLTVDQYTVFCTNFDSVYDQYYCSALHSNVVDATGNGTGMAATGTTLVADSSFGNVRSLNGSSEYIAVTDNDYLYNFTGLIYFPEDITSTTTSRGLILPFDIGTSWLYLNNSTSSITGETISLYKDSGIRFTSTVVSMGWHVLTIRWNGSAYDFYLDGTLCVMGTYGAEVPLTIGGFILGQGSSPYFNGKFGTVTRAITPRSTEWVRTESQSLKNTLLTYGPSQTNNTMSFFWMNF